MRSDRTSPVWIRRKISLYKPNRARTSGSDFIDCTESSNACGSTEGSLQPKIFSSKNVEDCSIDFLLKMQDFPKIQNFQIDVPRPKFSLTDVSKHFHYRQFWVGSDRSSAFLPGTVYSKICHFRKIQHFQWKINRAICNVFGGENLWLEGTFCTG